MDVDLVSLSKGRSWLLRPIDAGFCRFESLKDGTVDLADLALMNDYLDAKYENERRVTEALKGRD